MKKRVVNFPMAALIITGVGAMGTFAILETAAKADQYGYGTTLPQQESGEVPTLSEALEGNQSGEN